MPRARVSVDLPPRKFDRFYDRTFPPGMRCGFALSEWWHPSSAFITCRQSVHGWTNVSCGLYRDGILPLRLWRSLWRSQELARDCCCLRLWMPLVRLGRGFPSIHEVNLRRVEPGSAFGGGARKRGRERLLLRGIPRQGLEFAPVPDYQITSFSTLTPASRSACLIPSARPGWLWKKPSMALWTEDSPRLRPEEKPRFSWVDGHRIQRCCTVSTDT